MKEDSLGFNVKRLCDRLFDSATIDYVGFWELVAAVQSNDIGLPRESCRDVVISLARCMMVRGLKPFSFDENPKAPKLWQCDGVDDALDKIIIEWNKLEKQPGLGDVCWFMYQR